MTINTQAQNIINFFMDFIEEHCSKDAIRKIKSEEMQDQLMKLAQQEMTTEDTKEFTHLSQASRTCKRMNQRIDALEQNYQGIDKIIEEKVSTIMNSFWKEKYEADVTENITKFKEYLSEKTEIDSFVSEHMYTLEERIDAVSNMISHKDNNSEIDVELIHKEMGKLHGEASTNQIKSTFLNPRQLNTTKALIPRDYNDISPCTFRGVRYWQSTSWTSIDSNCINGRYSGDLLTRLFDYTTYEYVGILDTYLIHRYQGEYYHRPKDSRILVDNIRGKGILVNPVYAVKYKEKYPHLFDICISQMMTPEIMKIWHTSCPWYILRIPSHHQICHFASVEEIEKQLEEDNELHLKMGVYPFIPVYREITK